jgi:hypothetical protein
MANITRPRSPDALNNGAGRPGVAVSGRATDVTARHRAGRLWPFGVIPALAAAGAALVVLLVTVVVLGVAAHWPDQRWQGWLMLGVVLLALTPLLLLILDRVASTGGFVEFRGIKIAFAAQAAGSAVTLPPNMGIPPGASVADNGSFQLEAAMRAATANDVLVVDLEEGSAWWETRLFTLCSGARRHGRVRAIVFVATDHTVARTFQGWASPARLVQAMLDASPELRYTADNAAVTARRWDLAYAPGPPARAVIPLPDPVNNLPAYYPFNGMDRKPFADEEALLAAFAPLEQQPRAVTLARLTDMFGSILHAATIDEHDPDDVWMATALGSDDDYLAVTRGQVYVGLLSRSAVLARIVGVLAGRSAGA